MAKVAIPTRTVKCKDGSTDVYVELNSNSNADDKVQAFVDCFKGVAETARDICYGLPIKFILAQREKLNKVAFRLFINYNQ